jgi:hypothetical protein
MLTPKYLDPKMTNFHFLQSLLWMNNPNLISCMGKHLNISYNVPAGSGKRPTCYPMGEVVGREENSPRINLPTHLHLESRYRIRVTSQSLRSTKANTQFPLKHDEEYVFSFSRRRNHHLNYILPMTGWLINRKRLVKQELAGKTLSTWRKWPQCHFAHHGSVRPDPASNPGRCGGMLEINSLTTRWKYSYK